MDDRYSYIFLNERVIYELGSNFNQIYFIYFIFLFQFTLTINITPINIALCIVEKKIKLRVP